MSCSSSSAALCKQISKLKDPEKKKIKDFIQAITLTLPNEKDKQSFDTAFDAFTRSIQEIQVVINKNNTEFNEEFNTKFAEFKDKPDTIGLTIQLLQKRKTDEKLQGDSLRDFEFLIARLTGLLEKIQGKPLINAKATPEPTPSMLEKAGRTLKNAKASTLNAFTKASKSSLNAFKGIMPKSRKSNTLTITTTKNPLTKGQKLNSN